MIKCFLSEPSDYSSYEEKDGLYGKKNLYFNLYVKWLVRLSFNFIENKAEYWFFSKVS